jgi:hypothetical protein
VKDLSVTLIFYPKFSQMKSYQKCIGVAVLCQFALSCNSDKPIGQTVDTSTYHPKPVETAYVNQMDKEPDIYDNRNKLINKIKGLDKWLDFTGNYDEKSDETDNTISADDKFGFNVQIVGSKKHIKEVDFTYYPNALSGIRTYTLDHISAGVKILSNQLGSDWSSLHLGEILVEPDQSFKDSTIIDHKKMIIVYESEGKSIDLTITHEP